MTVLSKFSRFDRCWIRKYSLLASPVLVLVDWVTFVFRGHPEEVLLELGFHLLQFELSFGHQLSLSKQSLFLCIHAIFLWNSDWNRQALVFYIYSVILNLVAIFILFDNHLDAFTPITIGLEQIHGFQLKFCQTDYDLLDFMCEGIILISYAYIILGTQRELLKLLIWGHLRSRLVDIRYKILVASASTSHIAAILFLFNFIRSNSQII